jgi:hypothetical protein
VPAKVSIGVPVTAAGTVITDVALFPSLVAVIVDFPDPTAVTIPVELTVDTEGAAELHTTARPVRVAPLESLSVAVNCVLLPTATVAVAGLTVTVATGAGAGTVIEDVPVCVSLVAVIVAVPALTAVTRPVALTVDTNGASELHSTARPVRAVPLESLVVAVSC